MPDELDFNSLFSLEHPFYTAHKETWMKNQAAYSGGNHYIESALVKHISEPLEEYAERLKRAYYFNWPRKIARIITQYVLANRPTRDGADADICEDWSRTGLRVDEVMRQVSTMMNIYGSAWLAVDMPSFTGEKTKADEVKEKLRPYCLALSPLQVVDWCYGPDEDFKWVLVKETGFCNDDPFKTPQIISIRKLWFRDKVVICTRSQDGTVTNEIIQHNLGVIPFIRINEVDGYSLGDNQGHWFDDVVKISDAILNNESEAQTNTVKQMFGLLVVSDTFANNASTFKPNENEDTGKNDSVAGVISRSAAIIESAEDRGISRYIAPSGIENSTIRAENQALVKQMLECVGLTVSQETRLVESAESKLWDFQSVEQFMKTRADTLEQCEYRAWELMARWKPSIKVPKISYNRNFAVLDLQQSVTALIDLSGFNQENEDYQREIGKTAVLLHNRLRQLSQESQEKITKAIDSSTPIADAQKRQREELKAQLGEINGDVDGNDDDMSDSSASL